MSTVCIFGAVAAGRVPQDVADRAMEQVIAAGINHIDVAPSYGNAEERLGPWMERERQRFFLGCKTTERTHAGATAELQRSLHKLRVKSFDLYQFHGVTKMSELDQITAPGGALEAALEARAQGLTRYIGITGHGMQAPAIFLEALRRMDLDSVLFPINFVLFADPNYRRDAEALLKECRARDVGVMIIKAIAKAPWGDRPRTYSPWYEPFDDAEHIQQGVNFALSQDVTGLCSSGDVTILPKFMQACEQFTPLGQAEREALISSAGQYQNIFA